MHAWWLESRTHLEVVVQELSSRDQLQGTAESSQLSTEPILETRDLPRGTVLAVVAPQVRLQVSDHQDAVLCQHLS